MLKVYKLRSGQDIMGDWDTATMKCKNPVILMPQQEGIVMAPYLIGAQENVQFHLDPEEAFVCSAKVTSDIAREYNKVFNKSKIEVVPANTIKFPGNA